MKTANTKAASRATAAVARSTAAPQARAKPGAPAVAKAAAKPSRQPAAKKATPPAKKSAPKPEAKAAPQPAPQTAAKPAVKAGPASEPAKLPKEKKVKMVRDSISIPKGEYMVLDDMKLRSGGLGVAVKKTELIRAGIKALAALPDAAFLNAVRAVPNLKTGRPAKSD